MRKELFYIIFSSVLIVSCEDFYKPDLKIVPGAMVVEAHLTNDPSQNFVKLSIARDFYSENQEERITGARVEVVEGENNFIQATETEEGYYTFQETPVPGKKYMLRINYSGDIFESDQVTMPPLPTIDTLYTKHRVVKSYRTDSYGNPMQIEIPGREICIDDSITPALEYYRFSWRAIIQWIYNFPSVGGPPPPSLFGWKSIYQTGQFDLAGPKQFSVSDKIESHAILFLGYDSYAYLDSTAQIPNGWIVIIKQYGISKESYDFHDKLNKQLAAEGSLFDPVLTQVYGNIHCKTDPKKIVLGFFDLNSYRQYRYYINITGNSQLSFVNQRRLNRYPDIPSRGYVEGNPPVFWEHNR